MSVLDSITTGPISRPRRTMVYGVHGVGKTVWASKWPKPIIMPTELGSDDLNVARFPVFTSTIEFLTALKEVVTGSDYETIVVDSVDWLEALVQKDIDRENIDVSFGKGVIELGRRMLNILRMFEKATAAGKHVVLIGHAEQKTVTRPDGSHWTQYAPKLSKRAAAVVSEWVDELVFADYLITTVSKDAGMKSLNVGIDTGKRVLYTEGSGAFQAKHRKPNLKPKYELSDVDSYVLDVTTSRERK